MCSNGPAVPYYPSLWEGCRVLLSPELLGLWSEAHNGISSDSSGSFECAKFEFAKCAHGPSVLS